MDKKGVLSWPNPTAEKVFILTSRPTHPVHGWARHHSEKSKTPDREVHPPAEGGGHEGQHSKGNDHSAKSKTDIETVHCKRKCLHVFRVVMQCRVCCKFL